LLAHSKTYVDEIFNSQKLSLLELTEKEKNYNSVYLTVDTFKVSTIATGCLLQVLAKINSLLIIKKIIQIKFYLQVIDSVMSNESASGLAVIRPPGHHAENDEACGFCIFNSVAVGANYALNKFGLKRYATNILFRLTNII